MKLKFYFIAMSVCILAISCLNDSEENLENKKINLSKFNLSPEAIESFNNSVAFDENEKVIGFDFELIKQELNEEEQLEFLYFIAGTKEVVIGSKTKADLMQSQGVEPEAHIFHDKINWAGRPGCKGKAGGICIIYY